MAETPSAAPVAAEARSDNAVRLAGRRRRLDLVAAVASAGAVLTVFVLCMPFYQGRIATSVNDQAVQAQWKLTGMGLSKLSTGTPTSPVGTVMSLPDLAFWSIAAALAIFVGVWARTALITGGGVLAAVMAARCAAHTRSVLTNPQWSGEWQISELAGAGRLSLLLLALVLLGIASTAQVLAHNRLEREVNGEARSSVLEQIAQFTTRGIQSERNAS